MHVMFFTAFLKHKWQTTWLIYNAIDGYIVRGNNDV